MEFCPWTPTWNVYIIILYPPKTFFRRSQSLRSKRIIYVQLKTKQRKKQKKPAFLAYSVRERKSMYFERKKKNESKKWKEYIRCCFFIPFLSHKPKDNILHCNMRSWASWWSNVSFSSFLTHGLILHLKWYGTITCRTAERWKKKFKRVLEERGKVSSGTWWRPPASRVGTKEEKKVNKWWARRRTRFSWETCWTSPQPKPLPAKETDSNLCRITFFSWLSMLWSSVLLLFW